ncbi:MAG: hypothetical protein EB060_09515 [Proteobacteria bacterium]|nr:hypothetical protein [Pseudomonadota bacterium]
MAGYADALASILYPNSAQNSIYTMAGQGISKIQLPTFESPWASGLASALQGLAGAGLQGYGVYSANKENAENAAQMVPKLAEMGVEVPEGVSAGLSSEDPQTRALALALTEQRMKARDAAEAQAAEMRAFEQKERIKSGIELGEFEKKERLKGPQVNYENESKLRGELDAPAKQFQTTTRIFGNMIDAAGRDDKVSDITLISGIAKMRDPDSAVMQGEFKVNENAASFLENQFGNLRSVVEGSGRLTPEVRAKLLAAGKDHWENSRQQYEFAAAPRLEMARRQQMNPENVLMVPYEPKAYDSILRKFQQFGKPPPPPPFMGGNMVGPAAVAGPSPDGSPMVSMQAPADNVTNPFGLPPAPAGHEYRMSPDGVVLVRK